MSLKYIDFKPFTFVIILFIREDTMSEEAPTLKWGDIIRIHGVNLSKKDEESTKGLIVTKG